MRDRGVARDDGKRRAFENPPGTWDRAVGQESVVDDVSVVFPLKPLALEVERICGRVDARPRLDRRRGGPFYVVEIAIIVVHVILRFVAIELLAARKVLKMHVSPSLDVMRIGIPVDLIRLDLHIRRFNPDAPAQMTPGAILLLLTGCPEIEIDRSFGGVRGGVRADGQNLLTRVRADLRGLRRGRG